MSAQTDKEVRHIPGNLKSLAIQKKRIFYFGAVALALAAFITHGVARTYLDDYMHRAAARFAEVQKLHLDYTPDPQAVQSGKIFNALTGAGIALTALSAMLMIIARFRHERGWYLILLLLLFFDVVAVMLL
jgi:hypothetical protein